MHLFTRVEARDFRALFGRCVAGRPPGPAPPVVIQIKNGSRTVAATTLDGVILTFTAPANKERDDFLVLPTSVLAEVEGSIDETVTLERQSKLLAVVKWQGGHKPRTLPVGLILPGNQHVIPTPPEFSPVALKLLTAMHECGRTAARESGRYALSKIQFQGKPGRVIGTDSKVALLCGGFKFPFPDDILLPALPVFGAKPLSRISEVAIGRTATQVVIVAGPWSVWLPADSKSRYPDVAGVIPSHASTTVGIDGRDAVELLKVLPGLPGADEENRPVTLDARRTLKLRARDSATGVVKEMTLIRSPAAGPPACLAIDRRVLARAISLGCHTLKLTPDKPVVVEGEEFTLVAAPLDPALIVPPTDEGQKTSTDDPGNTNTTPTNPERTPPMKTPETNGHTPPRGDPPDPLFAAEELRDSLADATAKAARLVAALKAGRKEKKVLASVFANLKQLGLDSGGPP